MKLSGNIAAEQRKNFRNRNLSVQMRRILSNTGKFLLRKNTIAEFISALLIILFIYTGLNKLMDVEKFKQDIGRSPFIENMADFIAYPLPIGELLLSLLLIIKRTRLLGLYLSISLMALFTGYIWLMLNYAYDLPCSCGGIISKLSWNGHLVFNGVFTALAVVGAMLQGKIIEKQKTRITS